MNEDGWIFVNGGCGYLGSHICAQIKTVTANSVMMIDTRAALMPHVTRFCDMMADESFASNVMLDAVRDFKPDCIVHCADQSSSRKGLISPLEMWESNVSEMIKLLKVCRHHGVMKLIFFSTSEVYAPTDIPLAESDVLLPLTAYARTKLAMENLLRDCYIAHGISSVVFRTGCISGNHHLYDIGPLKGSPYLVPRIMESMKHGHRLLVGSKSHPTPDGTAVRDYLHVMDAASATIRAIEWLDRNPGCHVMNLGTGIGTSVQQMINLGENLLGQDVNYSYSSESTAEVPFRVLNTSETCHRLEWKPARDIKDILLDSWKWYNGDFYGSMHHRHDDD